MTATREYRALCVARITEQSALDFCLYKRHQRMNGFRLMRVSTLFQYFGPKQISRDRLAEMLNEDLAREYQAIITYVVYSQVLKGAEYMNIADQLETHAQQELQHALIISRQIDYLGNMPTVTPRPVKVSDDPKEMLKFDLDNENETVRNYRESVRQCEAIGEFVLAEQIRQILIQEQDHQIDLAAALKASRFQKFDSELSARPAARSFRPITSASRRPRSAAAGS